MYEYERLPAEVFDRMVDQWYHTDHPGVLESKQIIEVTAEQLEAILATSKEADREFISAPLARTGTAENYLFIRD